MGPSPASPHLNWAGKGQWIDPADYDHLIDKLVTHPDPEVVYVSGMISWHNQLYLGRCVRLDAGVPDHSGRRGMYGFRFLDHTGRMLSEVGLPVAWNHAEFHRPLPVTFFGVTLELPESATRLEIWNRGTGTRLGEVDLDRSVPEVYLETPERQGPSVVFHWRARDREGSALTYAILVSPDGELWWPAAYGVSETEYAIDTGSLKPGEYRVQILALNAIRVGRSNEVTVRLDGKAA
jgi:hypothetical protein